MTAPLTDEGTSRYVETASWKLHYNEAGEGHPVILLHGSGAGATGWSNFAPNIAALAEDFRVLALDAPGWGRSDAATSDTYDHPAAVLEFMDALGIERRAGRQLDGRDDRDHLRRALPRADLAPHHDGSGQLLLRADDVRPRRRPSEGLKILQEGYRNPTPEVMKRLVEIMTFSEHATDALAQQRADNAAHAADHLANFLRASRTRARCRPRLRRTDCRHPTKALLIHGRDDRVVHFEHSLRLVSMIADSRLVLLNRCGHWAQLEHAEEFNRLVRSFIADN